MTYYIFNFKYETERCPKYEHICPAYWMRLQIVKS